MKTSLRVLLFTLICCIGAPDLPAAPKPSATPSREENVIESVSANSVTVITQVIAGSGKILQKKNSKTFAITNFTEIVMNGQRASASELKPGMRVSVTAGTDPKQAARINANG